MSDNNRKTQKRRVGAGLSRDQLARAAMHLAPEHLFTMLKLDGHAVAGMTLGRARRMDTQVSMTPWLVDGLYLRQVGSRVELWLVEMQSRARRRSPARAGGLLLAAAVQLGTARPESAEELHVHLVEVRTQQAARVRRPRLHAEDVDEELAAACLPTPSLAFSVSNRLLLEGDWTACLLADPAAWPLWALGRNVGADAIFMRAAAVGSRERYGGWIATLLRWIGRVRFPHDRRFLEAPKERGVAMSGALAELVEDDRITADESEELARLYLERLDAQCEELREEGREEGRREALISLAESVSPDSVVALRSIDDLDDLSDAVLAIVRG